MLEVQNINSFYGELQVLRQVSLHVDEGEIVALFGPNGHGKSTLLKAISGLHPPASGSIKFKGEELTRFPAHKIVELGIAYIPEERHLFGDMTVMENLKMGAYNIHARKSMSSNLEFVFSVLPKLKIRQNQYCSTLSGGEARMVAIGRGLMSETSLLLIDEPSIGLSPGLRNSVFDAIARINNERKITILIVEQEIQNALALSGRFYMQKNGQIAFERIASEANVDEIEKAYF